MKIGFSFGRCIHDIVIGDVNVDDVMVIIARTYMETQADVEPVLAHYHAYGDLKGLDYEKCKEVALYLYHQGKIHQPRLFGTLRLAVPLEFVWMDLVPTVKDMSEPVRDAWDNYKMMLKLCSDKHEPDADLAPKV